MKKKTIDIVFILVVALFLIGLSQLGWLEQSAKFMIIPILLAYYLGQYIGRKFTK